MKGWRAGLILFGTALAIIAWARMGLLAQERRKTLEVPGRVGDVHSEPPNRGEHAAGSVLDALERPFSLPFKEPTRLDEVCKSLSRSLHAPVVLDRAALDRLDARPEDTVVLELEGVRLKTGLKLLLDQVGLTYKVVAEDNLLIVTDDQGSSDPIERVLAEMKALHRDLHDVQDSVDDLRALLGLEEEGSKMRKPTIIEELPDAKEAPKTNTAPQPRPRSG